MKKFRPIIAISLLVQSISFLIISLVNVEKRKNVAVAFGVFSAIGGIAGAGLLVSEIVDRKKAALEEDFYDEDYFDELLDEIDDLDLVSDDEIDCAFEANTEDATDAE